MSASREKKLRQGTEPAKNNADSKQNTTAKKKTVLYSAIAVVVVVLIAALLIWDSGMIQRNTVAATIGDTKYSPVDVSYYYTSAFQNVYVYSQYGLNDYNSLLAPEEQTITLDDGQVITYHDYFIDVALDSLHSITALYNAAIEAGYDAADFTTVVDNTIAETELNVKNSGYSSLKQWLVSTMGKSMTISAMRDIITREAIATAYLNDYKDSLEYSADELNAYYGEHVNELNTFSFGYTYFSSGSVSSTGENGKALSDAELEAAKAKAMESAKGKADAAAKRLEDASASDRAAVLDQLIEESESTINSSVVSKIGSEVSNSVYFEWLTDANRKSGDVGVIESSGSGYYVVLFMDNYLDETPSARIRHILTNATSADGSTTPTEADMDFAKTQTEILLQLWRAENPTEDSFATLAEVNSGDGRDENGNLKSPGGLIDPVYKGSLVPNLDVWIFDAEGHQPGEVAIIENNGDSSYYGYHAVYFCGYNEGDFLWKAAAKDALSSDDAVAYRDELMSNYTITEKSGLNYLFS